ncbi:Chemotaxis protein CheV [Piscirickettsia salmonis]|uniref:Response regulator n=1 Tax=Piscirickettsia salmonis TaxID=1238 RepID=A0A1L6TC37_PISSA|nr:chemotaxis protein CheV [Piscirickettsia salmonis]AKP74049.2 response regulator [Piscirickettsia salmonis LF-89 = ATCC VR-1361]ALB22911.1 response regulator [Piscirickettsia salmonis]ALY02871.1 response regulator [Piscirickettsia salmonis]AMA42426.1 response regulator [Piscirickettsia salmonis]AOS34896.1 response regulator [Piscirickettsia salmonis]
MSGVLDTVDQRTNLVGQNRLEILTFRLLSGPKFAINVFKVQEVLVCPKLTRFPKSNSCTVGVAHIRGVTMPIIDLSKMVGLKSTPDDKISEGVLIITEYNRSIQGFLVREVDRIINLNWDSISRPASGIGSDNYLTAVTKVDNELIEILDVEKVLAELQSDAIHIDKDILGNALAETKLSPKVLIVDDSITARMQIKKVVESLNLDYIEAVNGRDGLQRLLELTDKSNAITDEILIVISDAEMPEMDGYTFITEIRNDPRFEKLYIILHTSMSGSFNQNMVVKVGADGFLAKFQATKLAELLQQRIKAYKEGNHTTTVPSSAELAENHKNSQSENPNKLKLNNDEIIDVASDIAIEGLPSAPTSTAPTTQREPSEQKNQVNKTQKDQDEEKYLNQLLKEVRTENNNNNDK